MNKKSITFVPYTTKYIKIMQITTTYDREIKKGYVFENGYQVFEHDFNSGEFDSEIEMTEEKADEYLKLMEQEKANDEHFVTMED